MTMEANYFRPQRRLENRQSSRRARVPRRLDREGHVQGQEDVLPYRCARDGYCGRGRGMLVCS